jgi:hypothetical protein
MREVARIANVLDPSVGCGNAKGENNANYR